jgi:flavin reductase (DIM6/NTAB) family NADH-FMN oxidoreductase RutF
MSQIQENIIDIDLFRSVMGRFATGITVVTVSENGEPHGMTVNAFSSVSLNPVLLLICLDKQALTNSILKRTGKFTVNVLTSQQERLAEVFSEQNNEGTRFDDVPYHTSALDTPILEDTLGYLECTVRDEYDSGDHTIFIGEVVDLSLGNDSVGPLLFYNSNYTSFNP